MTQPIDLSGESKRVFLNGLKGLISRGKVSRLNSIRKEDSGWTVEFLCGVTHWRDTFAKFVVNYNQVQRSEPDPDPRIYGDTAEVTRAALANWYPGKRNIWTEHNLTIEAHGMPGLPSTVTCTASCDIAASWLEESESGLAYFIRKNLSELIDRQERTDRDNATQATVNAVIESFRNL